MIVIIDYGMGNLHSVENALLKIGCTCCISSDRRVIVQADQLILPGVGAFPDCMQALRNTGLLAIIQEAVLVKKVPLLGICLGMQVLFEEGVEGTITKGLGFLKGRIVQMEDTSVRIPHIGWNLLEQQLPHPLFSTLSKEPYVYYVHSFYATDYAEEDLVGYSMYGSMKLPGLVQKGNILGAQFHPEKSGEDGLQILRYFKEVCI